MKQTINKSDFRDAFHRMGRDKQFSYDALGALFDYYEEIDEEMELDVIAICCDWCEYDDLKAVKVDYNDITSLEDLQGQTYVIELENDGLIVESF